MASHNAKDPDRHEAYLLSQLRSVEQWQGHLVHLAIERFFVPALQRRALISQTELTEKTISLARAQWQFSERGDYKKVGVTKTDSGDDFLALREHEYGLPVSEGDFNAVIEKIRKC